jgi:hypothetical protein
VGGRDRSRRRAGHDPRFPEATIRVSAWPDPVLDKLGHDPRSGYVERFWLPVLGPSCLLLVRRLAADLERADSGFEIDTAQLAQELGIGMKGGRHGPLWRAVERACRFGGAHRNGDRLAIRRRLPPLTLRQVERLPASLRAEHERWSQARLERPKRPAVVRWTPRADEIRPASPGLTVEPSSPAPAEAADAGPGPAGRDRRFDDAA